MVINQFVKSTKSKLHFKKRFKTRRLFETILHFKSIKKSQYKLFNFRINFQMIEVFGICVCFC